MDRAFTAIVGGLTIAAMGLAIVFIVQLLIAFAVTLTRRADERWQHEEEQKDRQIAGLEDATCDHATLVLITAAVTTALGGRAFRLRRVRRLAAAQPRSAWSQVGRAALHASHRVR